MESIKLQIKADDWDVSTKEITLALCIIKWGGVLTPAGYHQCTDFAPLFRNIVLPTAGNETLQFNFLKNLVCYHTEEVRVRKTAKSFVKALFKDIANVNDTNGKNENNIDINSLFREGKYVQKMLDDISSAKSLIERSKFEIQNIFYNKQRREELIESFDDFNNENLKRRKITKKLKDMKLPAKNVDQMVNVTNSIIDQNVSQRRSLSPAMPVTPASGSFSPAVTNNQQNSKSTSANANAANNGANASISSKESSDEIIFFDETGSNSNTATVGKAIINNNKKDAKTRETKNNTNNGNNTGNITKSRKIHTTNDELRSQARDRLDSIEFDSSIRSNASDSLLHKSDIDISFMSVVNNNLHFGRKNMKFVNIWNKNGKNEEKCDENEELLPWTQRSLFVLQDPIERCKILHKHLLSMRDKLISIQNETNESNSNVITPYLDESLEVMRQRWEKIIEELFDSEKDSFDCSKIPDVFDSCRYDFLHNKHCFEGLNLNEIWHFTEMLSAFVIPQEYGLTKIMKQSISNNICKNLFLDIKKNIINHCINDIIGNETDGKEMKENENENNNNNSNTNGLNKFEKRCFLYFTSESYLHALRNALILSDIPHNKFVLADIEGMECSYFSHGVIRVFEDVTEMDMKSSKDNENGDDLDRFYVEIQFSPGAHANPMVETDDRDVIPVFQCGPLCGRYPLKQFLKFLHHSDQE